MEVPDPRQSGHADQVHSRRQGPNRLSRGCKRVRVWHSKGWGPRAWARAWSGLPPVPSRNMQNLSLLGPPPGVCPDSRLNKVELMKFI
jgi:hypothetical protein